MSKSEATLGLEKSLFHAAQRLRTFGAFEVTIGAYGAERADYLSLDWKGVWRCYEIKSSVRDFYSKARHTFVGNLNYYVMPFEVYEKVKADIPAHVGVLCGRYCESVKKAKKVNSNRDEGLLTKSLMRCLARESDKRTRERYEQVRQEIEEVTE